VTANLNLHYMKPARGCAIQASAEVVSTNVHLSVVRISVVSESEEGATTLCAFGTATLRAVPLPPLDPENFATKPVER
jgi:acyl-coenzyme A thioesterase PaaI-like protein